MKKPALHVSSAHGTTLLVLLPLVLGLFGRFTSFFRSQQWADATIPVVLAVSLLPIVWIVRAARRHQLGYPDIGTPAIRVMTALVLVPVFVIFFCWLTVAIALPDLFTRVAGKRFAETYELRKEYSKEYRGCDYRVIGTPFDRGGFDPYYCSWFLSEFEALPAQGSMRVRGRASWFGKHIDSVERANP